MKTNSKLRWWAGIAVGAALAVSPALGAAQTASVTTSTTTYPSGTITTRTYAPAVTTNRTVTTKSWEVNPNDPVQFPPASVGMNPTSHEGNVKAAYVDHEIALAKARGQDTTAAETQEVMGQAALRRGLNTEAAQHFDAALRSLGVTPAWPEHNSAEAGSLHSPNP